jgi:hypothetical protein
MQPVALAVGAGAVFALGRGAVLLFCLIPVSGFFMLEGSLKVLWNLILSQ